MENIAYQHIDPSSTDQQLLLALHCPCITMDKQLLHCIVYISLYIFHKHLTVLASFNHLALSFESKSSPFSFSFIYTNTKPLKKCLVQGYASHAQAHKSHYTLTLDIDLWHKSNQNKVIVANFHAIMSVFQVGASEGVAFFLMP